MYNCNDYIETFGNKESPDDISPEHMKIPFDILNAKTKEDRSNAGHFFEEETGKRPAKIICNKRKKKAYITKNELENHPEMYWKYETNTFVVECSYANGEEVVPFDEIHLMIVVIVADSRDGSQSIRFNIKKNECQFNGMKEPIQGFSPKKDPDVVCSDLSAEGEMKYSRIIVCTTYGKSPWECVFTYYLIPYTLFFFIVLAPHDEDFDLIETSSTLVLANVALLIVTQNNVFSFCERAVLCQIVILIAATFLLTVFGYTETIRITLAAIDVSVLIIILSYDIYRAKKKNQDLLKKLMKDASKAGIFSIRKSTRWLKPK